jgi:hypothetical protein
MYAHMSKRITPVKNRFIIKALLFSKPKITIFRQIGA